METRTLTMNAPAAKTFGWLHVNQTETVIPAAGRGIALAAQIPERLRSRGGSRSDRGRDHAADLHGAGRKEGRNDAPDFPVPGNG